MLDVVIRSRCVTIVHDERRYAGHMHSVIIERDTVSLLSDAGARHEVGVLTPDMAAAVRACNVAVVVFMSGPSVQSSAQARLVLS